MMPKLHTMLTPDRTGCGIAGRQRMTRTGRLYIVAHDSDRLYYIALAHEPITCRLCKRQIDRKGEPLPWVQEIRERTVKYLKGFRIRRKRP